MSTSSHGDDDHNPRYTADEATDILRGAFPNIGSPSLRFCGQGSDFCSYAVDECRIVRIGINDESAMRMNWERQLLPTLVQKLDIGTPDIEHIGETAEGAPFVVYPMIQGDPFDEDVYERMSPDARDAIAGQFADYLRVLHAMPVEDAYSYGIRERRADDVCRDFRSKATRVIYPDVSAAELATCEGLFDRYFEQGHDAYEPALIHGDLQPRHVLYDRTSSRLAGIIDYSDIWVGDPDYDLHYLHRQYGDDLLDRVLPRYGHADPAACRWKSDVFHLCRCMDEIMFGVEDERPDNVADGWRDLRELLAPTAQ
jgi:aminoglycoside 2''-phosphotransferase